MRAIVSLLLVSLILATVGGPALAIPVSDQMFARQAVDPSVPGRLSGANRYSVSNEISKAWPAGTDVVYVVSGQAFSDALPATARAGKARAPVLLSSTNYLPRDTRSALKRLRPTTIVIVGGTASISTEVRQELRPLASSGRVLRLSGKDRYQSAARVSSQYNTGVAQVFIANGRSFHDALPGAALAGLRQSPLLLTNGTSLDTSTRAELARLSPDEIVILGDTSLVPNKVAQLASSAADTGAITRLAGADRYGTSLAVAKEYEPGGEVYVASGDSIPDALTGAARAAYQGVPVVLTDPRRTPRDTTRALTYLAPSSMWLLGGEATLPRTTSQALAVHLSRAPKPTLSQPGTTGAAAVGKARYPIPKGAFYVSPSGADDNPGTEAAPFKTVKTAVDSSPKGSTIVLRRGTYPEQITIKKQLTIQNYPGEAVWLDGSESVASFERTGGGWLHRGWTTEFDASPTYTKGVADQEEAGWGFVDPDFPMAAHPDQMWVDGVAQTQVETLSQLENGTFFVDDQRDRLYLGTNPAGAEVRASTLDRAISVRAEGVTLRGFGVRRYSPSVPHMGTITMERPSITLENVHVSDNATTGISMLSTGQRLNRVTVARNGMLGVHGNHADRAEISHLLTYGNNTERFNTSPVSGGLKITRTREVSVSHTTARDNRGPGLWFDESVYGGSISTSDIRDNAHHGVSLEISSTMLFVGNIVQGNRGHGIKVNNTSNVEIWNNTFADNGRAINIVQDQRRGDVRSTAGHDPRRPFPDPDQSWINGPVTVGNNILAGSTRDCLLCVEDYSHQFSAEEMGVRASGNVYQRDKANAPQWVAVWSQGAGNPKVHTTVKKFTAVTRQEREALDLVGVEAVNSRGEPKDRVIQDADRIAQSLPPKVAALVDQAAGAKYLGAFVATNG